jgi:epoxyqueuosine reductase
MDFKKQIEKLARKKGAGYFGVAGLGEAMNALTTPYEAKLVSKFPVAISVGVPLMNGIVDGLEDVNDFISVKNYWFHVYEAVNPLIDGITLEIGRAIMDHGYNALIVPASQTVDVSNLSGLFSHKKAASLAGLGWIGKSCLLITPDRGPRVRFGTVLTDAPLASDNPLEGGGCGGCRKCVVSCPAHAFIGKAWKSTDAREERMDARKCFDYIRVTRKQAADVPACGICVYVCPFGSGKGKNRVNKHAQEQRPSGRAQIEK